MKVPDISEEERVEINRALRERKEKLEKLEEKTDEAGIPIDRLEERLALYRDRDELVEGKRNIKPGLLAIFADQPELSTEALENQKRSVENKPDLFGGGAETGGGHKAGGKGTWKSKVGRKKRGGEPEHIGEIITPPPPREPLALPAAGTPSNNGDVIDPTPNRPDAEGIADMRQATLVGDETNGQRDELAAAAAKASPTGERIKDVRADQRDTRMGGSADLETPQS